jgi:tetratricopeptide (TPR) repeat protein
MSKKSCAVISMVLIVGLMAGVLLLLGCSKPEPKQAEAPKQEAARAPAPQSGQQQASQPAQPAPAPPPAPQSAPAQTPPAQVGKGSTAPTAQTEVPTEAKLNMQQGMNYLRSRDYDNAIKEFTVAIQKFPAYDVAYSNRAVAYMQQKKFNKAMDDLKKAEEINPKNPTVYYNFVALYSLQGQLDRALDSLDRALELGFNNYDALRTDTDLNNVRKHPEFKKILEKHKVFIMN